MILSFFAVSYKFSLFSNKFIWFKEKHKSNKQIKEYYVAFCKKFIWKLTQMYQSTVGHIKFQIFLPQTQIKVQRTLLWIRSYTFKLHELFTLKLEYIKLTSQNHNKQKHDEQIQCHKFLSNCSQQQNFCYL